MDQKARKIITKMTNLELYNKAKDAYYNGTPIMEDFEFDELEKRLGLENKSYVGAKKNPAYTVQHPFIMGSLSKVQIKEDENGKIHYCDYVDEINKYLCRNRKDIEWIVTPKFDGCSFEAQVENGLIKSISSRGDGYFGKDLTKHLKSKAQPNVDKLSAYPSLNGLYVVRGEVLIDRSVFEKKYSDFVNPRSFVSGILNRDYCNDEFFLEALNDLSIVIYEIRYKDVQGWHDEDWDIYEYPDKPDYYLEMTSILNGESLEYYYKEFSRYRKNCQYALDGIVFKPMSDYRENNLTEPRPKDCVAVKFVPMLQETEVVDIKWQLSNKTGEYTPVIIVNPVIMDGKEVTKASAHNYGYIIENKISVGTKVILSLAGDIIPFIYKVTDTKNYKKSKICVDNIADCYIDGVHLFKKLSEEETIKAKFLASADILKIPGIGKAAATAIFTRLPDKVDNILKISPDVVKFYLGGKSGENCAESFSKFTEQLTIKDIVMSCAIPMCGDKAAEQIENEILCEGDGDWTGLPKQAYEWLFNEQCLEYYTVYDLIFNYIDIREARAKYESKKAQKSEQIPIIMTGEPTEYPTKAEFLKAHPEYRETGSWKEVKILFTGSLESNSGKMKKAREKGIEIRLY